MPKIVFVHPDGARQTIEAKAGTTIMQAATANGIDEIVAECGGSCMCATCHVYIDEADLARLPKIETMEEEMLDSTAAERRPNSRLSCQLTMTAALDGIVVHLPDQQV
jgi:2Fe-2S ferredoxin